MADDGLLTDHEKTALIALLKGVVDEDRYPLSPRICTLKAILAKLEPSKPVRAPPPPLRHAAIYRNAAEGAALRRPLGSL